eukprot:479965_1
MSVLRQKIEVLLMNTFHIDQYYFTEFEFKVGSTWFSSIYYPFFMILFYCIGIPALQRFMKNKKSPPLKWVLIVHNLFLSGISFFLLIFLSSSVLSYLSINYSYHQVFCSLNHHDQ